VLCRLEGVIEAAVVGVPDPILGYCLKAFVVVNNQRLAVAEVLAHCRAHLEEFMVPKSVEFRESLPKSSSGKTKKQELV